MSVFSEFRKVHNQYKKDLICKYCKHKDVLDLGSGKGGDIFKYQKANVNWITFVEPNKEFIKECKERIKLSQIGYKSNIINVVAERFNSRYTYDVVCMFFVLSFFFQTEELCVQLIKTIKKHLKPGGYFIGTTLNGDQLSNQLKISDIIYPNYSIKKISCDFNSKFGQTISFDLKDSETATFQIETLVHFQTFVECCKQHQLVLTHINEYKPDSRLNEEENSLTVYYLEFVLQYKV